MSIVSFYDFVSELENKVHGELPGEVVQFEMAPLRVTQIRQAKLSNPKPKQGAVLILLYPGDNQPYFLLTKRNEYDGPHSGQVCFPGGKFEPQDQDLYQTALRETREELGIDTAGVRVIGELSPIYIVPSKFSVKPVIAVYPEKPVLAWDRREVAEVIPVGLSDLKNPENKMKGSVFSPSVRANISVPYFNFNNHRVWGATAMILNELKWLVNEVH